MRAYESVLLQPITYGGSPRVTLASGTANDAMLYDVSAVDYIVVQGVADGTWHASLVVTVEVSLDGQVFEAFPTAVTLSASLPMSDRIEVIERDYVRVRVSTTGGSHTVRVIVNGVRAYI